MGWKVSMDGKKESRRSARVGKGRGTKGTKEGRKGKAEEARSRARAQHLLLPPLPLPPSRSNKTLSHLEKRMVKGKGRKELRLERREKVGVWEESPCPNCEENKGQKGRRSK